MPNTIEEAGAAIKRRVTEYAQSLQEERSGNGESTDADEQTPAENAQPTGQEKSNNFSNETREHATILAMFGVIAFILVTNEVMDGKMLRFQFTGEDGLWNKLFSRDGENDTPIKDFLGWLDKTAEQIGNPKYNTDVEGVVHESGDNKAVNTATVNETVTAGKTELHNSVKTLIADGKTDMFELNDGYSWKEGANGEMFVMNGDEKIAAFRASGVNSGIAEGAYHFSTVDDNTPFKTVSALKAAGINLDNGVIRYDNHKIDDLWTKQVIDDCDNVLVTGNEQWRVNEWIRVAYAPDCTPVQPPVEEELITGPKEPEPESPKQENPEPQPEPEPELPKWGINCTDEYGRITEIDIFNDDKSRKGHIGNMNGSTQFIIKMIEGGETMPERIQPVYDKTGKILFFIDTQSPEYLQNGHSHFKKR